MTTVPAANKLAVLAVMVRGGRWHVQGARLILGPKKT
jgi:hypothetical protein